MLKKNQALHHVHSLAVRGKPVVDALSITQESQKFYSSLYNIPPTSFPSGTVSHAEKVQEYLMASAFPGLPSRVIEELKRSIAIAELGTVVSALTLGKNPGSDGFTNT